MRWWLVGVDVERALARAAADTGAHVYHAGTARDGGHVVTAGGRVLGVSALGATVGEARDRAYEAVDLISFEGRQVRRDIAGGMEDAG